MQVDLNPAELQSKGLSALDVVNAIAVQNLILPTGTSKIGGKEYDVDVPNAAPQTIAELNRIPIKTIGSTTIYVKDVAWVRDGFPPQTNIVRVNGQRSVLLTIQKAGNASTLKVIAGIKSLLPQIAATVPRAVENGTACRPIYFCSRSNQRSSPRSFDRRLSDGFNDSDFLGQLAQHAYYRDFNSSGHPHITYRAERNRPDHQHHDARRVGARCRHPCGRRNRGSGKH